MTAMKHLTGNIDMNQRNFVLSILTLITLSACVTDPYTREQRASRVATGAAGGALIGAAVGAVVEDDSEGAIKGAIAGAALGAGAGFYMDRQAAALRAELNATGIRVEQTENAIKLIMPGDVTFATDSADVQSGFYSVLNSVAKVVDEFDQTSVNIAGHTDSTGRSDHNQTLSEQRAQSVADYLSNQGVASGRLDTTGYGERYPIASNDTETGRSANRRVEIDLELVDQPKRRRLLRGRG